MIAEVDFNDGHCRHLTARGLVVLRFVGSHGRYSAVGLRIESELYHTAWPHEHEYGDDAKHHPRAHKRVLVLWMRVPHEH